MKKKTILIVDDHLLFSNSLQRLVDNYPDYEVADQLRHGEELIDYLEANEIPPDLVLLDINMPVMGGREAMKWLRDKHPDQKVLVLSMDGDDTTIISMIRLGARGYILKDIGPLEFKEAIDHVIQKGFYHSDRVNESLLKEVITPGLRDQIVKLKDREITFLELVCTEMTYKEIAGKMFLSPKTIDGYREALFKKLGVKSRIGLAIYAIKNKIVIIK